MSLPDPSSSDLRARQSVRATFKLSEKAIEALSILSIHLGIKQKSLFDHLLEDMEELRLIAQEIKGEEFISLNRVQKTYVISRKTLSSLDTTSKTYETPRDALVEFSIQRLLPLIATERERHQRRKEILRELTEHLRVGERILRKSKEFLGQDDPVNDRLESAMTVLSNVHRYMETFVGKGKAIEDF
jgi:hypothetical protein